MWKRIKIFRPSRRLWNKVFLLATMAGIAIVAFCWGRRGALSEAQANPPADPVVQDRQSVSPAGTDYNKRVVAYIYNNIPVTREDLGEYLIARFGTQRVEFLVNRRIVELACQAKGISVSDAEVEAQMKQDLASFGTPAPLSETEFVSQILRRFNKSLFEWKEDVVRPKLALSKLCRPRVVVTEEDVRKAFESKYGEKVQCRMIVLSKDDRRKEEIWSQVSKSEEAFKKYAKEQFISALGAKGGQVPPIHRHFADKEIEREAFSLKVTEVSRLLQMPPPDLSWVILKCDGRIPPDTTKRLEEERLALHREISEVKLQQEIPKVFQELRQHANPVIFLRDQIRQEDLERDVRKALAPAVSRVSDPPPIK